MTPITRTLLLAVSASVALTALPAGAPAQAQAIPLITVTTPLDVALPRTVPAAASGQSVPITFTINTTEPIADASVSAYAEDGSLVVSPAQSLGTLSGSRQVTFNVAGAAPGMHELVVAVTSPAMSGFGSLPNVWTAGSPLFGSKEELDPMSFGWQGSSSGGRSVRMISILPGGWAYTGLPAKGMPRCKSEGGGCQRYAYNSESDVLQVGSGIIGALTGEDNPPGLYTEGLAAPGAGQLYGATDSTGPAQFATKTTNLVGKYGYAGQGSGLTREKVTFLKKNKYKLEYASNGHKVRKLKGTYKLTNKGRITFKSNSGKVVQVGSVLVLDKASSEHGTFRPGIWLILGGKKGTKADGNLLLKQ